MKLNVLLCNIALDYYSKFGVIRVRENQNTECEDTE